MHVSRRDILLGAAASGAGVMLSGVPGATLAHARTRKPALINGIIWQIHGGMLDIHGEWEMLGANTLMLQWIVADGKAFVPGLGLPVVEDAPNWRRIRREPWTRRMIVGLATQMDEPEARRNVAALVELSARIARQKLPFRAAAWYFPVEADPTWADVGKMGALLSALPRPLWVSAYDNSNIGAEAFANWVEGWLPKDVGLMFQDGVGLHMRTPESARHYGQVLGKRLGPERFTMIAEAFRPAGDGQMRPATLNELGPQLLAYQGFEILVFDGPHYLNRKLIYGLAREYLPRLSSAG